MSNTARNDSMEVFFSGKKLYGNDFSKAEIDEWFGDEADGYFNLTKCGPDDYSYGYHALNMRHGYSILPKQRFGHVLGLGSAYGDELVHILKSSDHVSILEPADGFESTTISQVPVNYIKPLVSGLIPFASGSIDLITCLGVLHHIPNVGTVINEFHRVLKPGGFALLREPIISMGDWRKPRVGLTKRERGIPLMILRDMVQSSGLRVVSERKCMFSLTSRLRYLVSGPVFNNPFIVAFDQLLCALPIWPKTYHARNILQKFCPTAVYFVLQKPLDTDSNT